MDASVRLCRPGSSLMKPGHDWTGRQSKYARRVNAGIWATDTGIWAWRRFIKACVPARFCEASLKPRLRQSDRWKRVAQDRVTHPAADDFVEPEERPYEPGQVDLRPPFNDQPD